MHLSKRSETEYTIAQRCAGGAPMWSSSDRNRNTLGGRTHASYLAAHDFRSRSHLAISMLIVKSNQTTSLRFDSLLRYKLQKLSASKSRFVCFCWPTITKLCDHGTCWSGHQLGWLHEPRVATDSSKTTLPRRRYGHQVEAMFENHGDHFLRSCQHDRLRHLRAHWQLAEISR